MPVYPTVAGQGVPCAEATGDVIAGRRRLESFRLLAILCAGPHDRRPSAFVVSANHRSGKQKGRQIALPPQPPRRDVSYFSAPSVTSADSLAMKRAPHQPEVTPFEVKSEVIAWQPAFDRSLSV